jgi:hypothetical protein
MPQFVLAFPLNVACDEPFKVTDHVSIDKDTANVIIPGCGVQFSVVRQAAAAGLSGLFAENDSVSPEESAAIDAHKSLLFLLGEVKSIDDVSQVDSAILKILAAGALGVYMQQSGTAWTAERFREVLGDVEFPMDSWINFVEGDNVVYTLGMAAFSLPDLCLAKSVENAESALLLAADAIYGDGIPAKSGSEVDVGEGEVYVLRAEAKNPFPKDSPEYNKQGILRLVRK